MHCTAPKNNGPVDHDMSRSRSSCAFTPPRMRHVQRLMPTIMVKSRVAPIEIPAEAYGYISRGDMRVMHDMYSQSPPKKRQSRRRSSEIDILRDQRSAEQLLKVLDIDCVPSDQKIPSQQKQQKKKRNVSFGEVNIREYDRTLSSHPMCSDGIAIGLDWEYFEQPPIDIDDYEADKLMYQGKPKTREQMHMGVAKRRHLLRSIGHTERELQEVAAESQRQLIKSTFWQAWTRARR